MTVDELKDAIKAGNYRSKLHTGHDSRDLATAYREDEERLQKKFCEDLFEVYEVSKSPRRVRALRLAQEDLLYESMSPGKHLPTQQQLLIVEKFARYVPLLLPVKKKEDQKPEKEKNSNADTGKESQSV